MLVAQWGMAKKQSHGQKLREDVLKTYASLGGPKYLRTIAEIDPKSFLPFLLKMIPSETSVSGSDGGPVEIKVVTGVSRSPEDEDSNSSEEL